MWTKNWSLVRQRFLMRKRLSTKNYTVSLKVIFPWKWTGKKFLLNDNIPKLSDEDKQFCDSSITLKECRDALSELKNNKSPGCDGFPVEFYKFFWNKIKNFLLNSYTWSEQNKMLSNDQTRWIITLVRKKGKDPCVLKNWRPISCWM